MLELSRIFAVATVTSLFVATATAPTGAQPIHVQLDDFGLIYQGNLGPGGAILDSTAFDGNNLDPTEAEIVDAIEFRLNSMAPPASGGNNVFVSGGGVDYYGDFRVDDVGATIPIGVSTVGGGGNEFGFDLFSSSGGESAPILQLELDSVDVLLDPGVLTLTAQATLVAQNLPFGLLIDDSQDIVFAYASADPSVSGTATDADLITASGTVFISARQVPEPSSAALMMTAAVAILWLERRRRVN